MNYGQYKNARNASWQCLIDYKINSLPVKVSWIVKQSNIALLKNSAVNLLSKNESGTTLIQNDKFYIIYADGQSHQRCRFTIAHELGHIFLGHLFNKNGKGFLTTDDTESSANVFARDLLAPACVLHELQVLTAPEISQLCNISLEAATYRAERMKELERRNAFYLHPLEKQVKEQFAEFINKKKNLP
ncbi:MAG: ImmA/IrrE family metallo-endopeptidase [Ruminococcus sp.]|nr:ImmA/IrrE family metallo-endopeptidase [Ruminococcus sp.]